MIGERLRMGLALAVATLAVSGCAMAPVGDQAPSEADEQVASPDPIDVFVAMIGAERWGVLIDRAREAVREARPADPALDDNELLRADRAVKSGAAELILLRNEICAKGLMTPDQCRLESWPAWTLETPDPGVALEVVEQRSDWLGEAMQRFVSLGCEVGREASGDDMYCSVE